MTTNYLMNALGQRVGKTNTNNTTYFTYDSTNLNLLGEYDQNASTINEYIYLGNQIVGVENSGNLYYVFTDQINTPRQILDTNNNTVWQWDNVEPFGNNQPTNTSLSFNLRFPGQYFDNETNLNYNYFRNYDSSIGRYVQSDPIGLSGGMNTYAYVIANSLLYSDNLGLDVNIQNLSNNIIIHVPIGLSGGNGIDLEAASKFMQDRLNNFWNHGWKYGKCNVTFDFQITPNHQELNNIVIADRRNLIRSFVNSHPIQNGVIGNSGMWSLRDFSFEHEVGHLMGLNDEYYEATPSGKTVTYKGWKNNIMSTMPEDGGHVEQRNVMQIINNNQFNTNKGCSCIN